MKKTTVNTTPEYNGAVVVDTRDLKIEDLEKLVNNLKRRIEDLEERVFGYHE